MGLSCECDFDWWEGEGWTFRYQEDFIQLKTKKRRRCCSCKKFIELKGTCLKFNRFRYPATKIEIKIAGKSMEVHLAPWYMCEECGGIFLSLSNLGFCIDIGAESMKEILKEYHAEYNPVTWKATKATT